MNPIEGKYIPEPNSGCWIWMQRTNWKGYGEVSFKGKNCKAHRVAWEITHGPIPKGMFVCHRCDVRPCVNPAHLFLGDNGDNMRDCARKGRHWMQTSPERATNAKLTASDVRLIRSHRTSASRRELASRLGVSVETIRRVLIGKTFRRVPQSPSEAKPERAA